MVELDAGGEVEWSPDLNVRLQERLADLRRQMDAVRAMNTGSSPVPRAYSHSQAPLLEREQLPAAPVSREVRPEVPSAPELPREPEPFLPSVMPSLEETAPEERVASMVVEQPPDVAPRRASTGRRRPQAVVGKVIGTAQTSEPRATLGTVGRVRGATPSPHIREIPHVKVRKEQ